MVRKVMPMQQLFEVNVKVKGSGNLCEDVKVG